MDVKKVLVIGSGGLSIGQAGEFDYSGGYSFSVTRRRPGEKDARQAGSEKAAQMKELEKLAPEVAMAHAR